MALSRNVIRKYIRFIHRWLGLVAGVVVLIVALTGSILSFEEEGREYFQHDYYHITPPGTARLPLDQLVDSFRVYNPKTKINSIRFKETMDAAFVFYTKDRYVFMDPYTARIITTLPLNRDFFTVVRIIHTELYLGETGKTIIHWNVLLFFFSCISGLILWWPRKWRFVRQAVRIDLRSGNAKRVNYDLHRALGFYALPVLLVISCTGLFMAFDTTKNIVAFITRSPVPAKEDALTVKKPAGTGHGHFSLEAAYAYTREHYPGARETFATPGLKETPIRIVMRYPFTILRRQNTFYFNQWDGTLLKTELYADYNGYDKVARSNYNLHTGKIGPLGIGSKILYCLAALAAASLPITGVCIWLGKKKKQKMQ